MLHPPEHAGATIDSAPKTLRLLREAAASRNTRLSLADNLAEIFDEAKQAGLGNEDWAVGQYRMAQRRGIREAMRVILSEQLGDSRHCEQGPLAIEPNARSARTSHHVRRRFARILA